MNISIISILEEKLQIFKEFEVLTKNMLRCSDNDFTRIVERRQELIDQINALDEKMWKMIDEGSEEELAIKQQINRGQLSGQKIGLYDQSSSISSTIARIIKVEPEVLERMEGYKKSLSEDVKQVNNVPKIAKYFSESVGSTSTGFRTI